jgi:hypothetical protein
MKRPAFQFYPADWRKDVELRSCSVAARGLWIDMLCLAHECEPYGNLVVNGKPMKAAQIAGQVGLTPGQCEKLIAELVENGVARVKEDGTLYSKRMVDDEDLRNRRAEGGKAGSVHGIKGAEHGVKGGRPATARGVSKPPSEPPPSSSSSPSGKHSEANASGATAPSAPSPKDVVFSLGVPLLTAAGVKESNGRSFLAMQCKTHGDAQVAATLEACAIERPIQPIPWIQERLKPKANRVGKHTGFDAKNYHDGVTPDGILA